MESPTHLTDELRSALAHLDDPPYLESHPLTRRISYIAEAPDLSRGQLLRRTLRLAIEALDPGSGATPNAPEARSYAVLHRYAIAKESMVAIAANLGISERQAYRELRQATEALAQILCELAAGPGRGLTVLAEGAPTRAAKVREEVERLSRVSNQEVDVVQLVAAAVESARHLARERGIGILLAATGSLRVVVNRVMLRQAVLNLLSHMVSQNEDDRIDVRLSRCESDALLELTYHPRADCDLPQSESPYAVALQLFASLGLRWRRAVVGAGLTRISVLIPLTQERTLLIIDDNEGLIALFGRYLRHHPYRVLGAATADEALAILDEASPDLIILDVMMPDRDGWEVLQALRAREAGAQARIIVCSIINDPQLAAALGANAFLHKPVDQRRLLQALEDAFAGGA